jgi:hypothetical protein
MTTSRHCQRWTGHRMRWQYAQPSERFTGAGYEVEPIDQPTAAGYIAAHHYLRSYPADRKRYGLWRRRAGGRELVGVAVYGVPSNKQVLTNWLPGLEPYVESLAFQRLVLADQVPGNAESWMVARCRELLVADGVLGTVTFADPQRYTTAAGAEITGGHVGFLYQGDNWVACGRGTARTILLLEDGSRLDDRTLQKIRKQEAGHEAAERHLIALGARTMRAGEKPALWLPEALQTVRVRKLPHPGCHRYVRPHRRDVRVVNKGRRIRRDPAAYPKPEQTLLDLIAGAA